MDEDVETVARNAAHNREEMYRVADVPGDQPRTAIAQLFSFCHTMALTRYSEDMTLRQVRQEARDRHRKFDCRRKIFAGIAFIWLFVPALVFWMNEDDTISHYHNFKDKNWSYGAYLLLVMTAFMGIAAILACWFCWSPIWNIEERSLNSICAGVAKGICVSMLINASISASLCYSGNNKQKFEKLKQQEDTKSFAIMFEAAIWISLTPWLCLGLAFLAAAVKSIADKLRRGGRPAREPVPEFNNRVN